MKKYYWAICIFLISKTNLLSAFENVQLPISKIFSLENGFDSNDFVEIAIAGFLPDTCHQLGAGKFSIDHKNFEISVGVNGYIKENQLCLNIVTPYLEIIQIGTLKEGRYKILNNQEDTHNFINVSPADTSEQDQFLYAPVEIVDVIPIKSEKGIMKQKLKIEGTYPYLYTGCMKINEIKISKTRNNILIVQPIAEILEQKNCNNQVEDFNRFKIFKDIEIPSEEQSLVHVRTLNGRAVNKLYDPSFIEINN